MADAKPENFGNSVDWWISTKSPPDIFRPDYQNVENDKIIRETAGVDPAFLVGDLRICEPHIRAYQRKLGVRKLTGTARKGR